MFYGWFEEQFVRMGPFRVKFLKIQSSGYTIFQSVVSPISKANEYRIPRRQQSRFLRPFDKQGRLYSRAEESARELNGRSE